MNVADIITQEEEIRLKVYDDATGKDLKPGMTLVGNPTIGVGCELAISGITSEEAFYLRDNRIRRATDAANTFKWFSALSETRKAVIVSMVFNLGLNGFCEFRKMISALERSDFAAAADQMLNSKWSAQVKGRAVRLATLMRGEK